jgi:ATP-dependent Clp protease adaptor protein ClpS
MENIKEMTDNKTKKPKKYVAVINNDDFTSFDMVILILQRFFEKSENDATVIANEVHKNGSGVAGGPYTFEVCETKCYMAMNLARQFEMPLAFDIQEA